MKTNFNNVWTSFCTLFEASTTEGWIDLMWSSVDANEIDLSPITHNKQQIVIFFLLFIFASSFFLMNLFIGVICDTFAQEKEKNGENIFLTDNQKKWIQNSKKILSLKPYKSVCIPTSNPRKFCYYIAENKFFNNMILGCIIVNTILLAIKWQGQLSTIYISIEVLNVVFLVIFTGEAIIKLLAYGRIKQFDDSWNIFDFTIVVIGWIGQIIVIASKSQIGILVTMFRAFRLGRMFRIMKHAKNMRTIF